MPFTRALRLTTRCVLLAGGFAASVVVVAAGRQALGAPEEARPIPAPALENAREQGQTAVAVLAGGCFWGVQGVFQHVKGVSNAFSGYAGGDRSTADYEKVSRGWTGHAEAVRITYDPSKISYGKLLQVFFSVAHDPTQLDRQGPDRGTQYRSAIFPQDEEQRRVAETYIAQLDGAATFGTRIVTKIETERPFYPAEAYHQDYLTLHPTQPYIVINDLPKVESLKRLFPSLYRNEPALVAESKAD